ncbi:hypothetical protein ACJJH9_13935 [Microbulbifer sp. DLAB2-AF]|uniref:hypothetical protein n=1 Tax=Microbulbifer sp. DLAB2-AF TaxID=3243395 RepID=UPI00403923DE
MILTPIRLATLIWLPVFLIAVATQLFLTSVNEHDSSATVYYLYSAPVQTIAFVVGAFGVKGAAEVKRSILFSTVIFIGLLCIGYIGVWLVYFLMGGRM